MNRTANPIRPMTLRESLLTGLIIAGLGILCFYWVRPQLELLGLNGYAAYLLSLTVLGLAMLAWSALALLGEGNIRTFASFVERVRLNRLVPKWLAWSAGLGLVMFLSTILFSPIMAEIIGRGILPLPAGIPDYINPLKQTGIAEVKAQLVSQGVIPLIPLVLAVNILSEEIFWRGIILPRQELRHGKLAFWVHGTIWAFTHLFQYWLLAPILLGSLALAYVIQRTRCTWIGIAAHLLNNSLPFILMMFV